ncbi:TIGR03905 family TSCPD domain-containing protein [bacterium D16-54]|nr:TIGR03905 family TSCPD domain-containing protein [bacterium D16-54]RKJ13988.1 TIGR03905 family TSCPD domain-containing protein [bacterium D16-56]
MVYKTHNVCSREIHFDVKDHKLTNVKYIGGCSGNTQGVARLVEGMDINEAIERLEGIHCGFRPTSCPDQLAQALKAYAKENGVPV